MHILTQFSSISGFSRPNCLPFGQTNAKISQTELNITTLYTTLDVYVEDSGSNLGEPTG
jgi:hypothetical protein